MHIVEHMGHSGYDDQNFKFVQSLQNGKIFNCVQKNPLISKWQELKAKQDELMNIPER